MLNGSISTNIKVSEDKHDDYPIHLRIKIPEQNNQQSVVHFHASDTIWAVKMKVLASVEIELVDPLNYGLYLPGTAYKCGKFLDEERLLKDYHLPGPMPIIDFKKKHRINFSREQNSIKIKKLQTQTTKKEFIQYVRMFESDKMSRLLNKGFDPNFNDLYDGETPLTMLARQNNSRAGIIALVNGGALLDFRNRKCETALHVAVKVECRSSLRTLLDLGSSVNYKDGKNLTPLYYCVLYNTEGLCLQMLLHERAFIGCRDEKGWTEIHHACSKGNSKHVEQLLFYGADINALTNDNDTPLHICAQYKQLTCANDLLSRGADRNLKNSLEETAEDIAMKTNQENIAKLIRNFKDENIILFDGMPDYNEKRRGTISAATLRNLFRSRSIPNLNDQYSDEYKSLSVSPTNFKTILQPFTIQPVKHSTRVAAFDLNWDDIKKEDAQPTELKKVLENFDTALLPENKSVEHNIAIIPPPPPLPPSLPPLLSAPKLSLNGPTTTMSGTLQRKSAIESSEDKLRNEIIDAIKKRKSVLDELDGDKVNNDIERQVNKTKKTVFKSYQSLSHSTSNDSTKSPNIKSPDFNDNNKNITLTVQMNDTKNKVNISPETRPKSFLKVDGDLVASSCAEFKVPEQPKSISLFNQDTSTGNHKVSIENIEPSGDFVADAQQVLQTYLTLTKKSKLNKTTTNEIDASAQSNSVVINLTNAEIKENNVTLIKNDNVPVTLKDDKFKYSSETKEINSKNEPSASYKTETKITNSNNKEGESTLRKPLLIRSANSIHETKTIDQIATTKNVIKIEDAIKKTLIDDKNGNQETLKNFPPNAKPANSSIKIKSDNNETTNITNINNIKMLHINGENEKLPNNAAGNSTKFLAKNSNPVVKNSITSSKTVYASDTNSTLVNSKVEVRNIGNTKPSSISTPNLIKPTSNSIQIATPSVNQKDHSSFILKPPEEFSTGTSKRYNAANPRESSNSTVFLAKSSSQPIVEKNVAQWSSEEVAKWLTDNGLSMYKEMFIRSAIDGRKLVEMGQTDLEGLGVSNLLHRLKIENNVRKLQKQL